MRVPAEKPRGIMGGRPVPHRLDFYACGFEAAYEYVITPDAYLQGAAEEAFPDYGTLGAFGKTHVREPFAYFPS
jgi:hypothetical protein